MRYTITFTLIAATTAATACDKCANYDNADFKIKQVVVQHDARLAATIWEVSARATMPSVALKPTSVALSVVGNT